MSSVDPAAVLKRAYTEGVNPDYLAAGGFASDDMARVIGQGGGSGAQLRQATVTSYSPSPGTAVIVIGGGGTEYEARCLDGYAPFLGESVWCLRQGADTLVIGPVGGAGACHARGPSGALTAGNWYRVGYLRSNKLGGTDRASAEFAISDPASGRHTMLRLRAGAAYNNPYGTTLHLEEYTGYSSTYFSAARIVALDSADRTYSGAALDIKVRAAHTGSVSVRVENEPWPGGGKWEAVPFTSKGTSDTPPAPEEVLTQVGLFFTDSWIDLNLLNLWENYGTSWPPARVMMKPGSLVVLDGLVRNGTINVPLATLPEGMRPEWSKIMLVGSGDTTVNRLDINSTSGNIQTRNGTSTPWWSLSDAKPFVAHH